MTISELKNRFKEELSSIYNESEINYLVSYFLEKILSLNSIHQKKNSQQTIDSKAENQFIEIIHDLKTGKPYQHILGESDFYGLTFFVNKHVLIPRPETEELLEFAINKIKESDFKNPKILDIGTGSGVIPIILKKYFPEAEITSIDISEDALFVAQKNAKYHQAEISFIQNDYLNYFLDENFDIIISNPPYIGIEENMEIENSVKNFEPNIALFSPTSDALIFYRKIASDAKSILRKNGMIFLEINQKLGQETLELFENFSEFDLIKDISGNNRIVFAKN